MYLTKFSIDKEKLLDEDKEMFEYWQIPAISNSPKYVNLLRKQAIGYQIYLNNYNDPNITPDDILVSKNEILEVFIELLDDWVDLEL